MNSNASRPNEASSPSQTRRLSEAFASITGRLGPSETAGAAGATPQLTAMWPRVDVEPSAVMDQLGVQVTWSTTSMRRRNAPADCAFFTGVLGGDVLVYAKFFPISGSTRPYRLELQLLPAGDSGTPEANLTHLFRIVDEVLGVDDIAKVIGAYVGHCLGRAGRGDQDRIIADVSTAISEVLRDRVA